MPANPSSPDSIKFPGISSCTQIAWRKIIKSNITDLNKSKDLSTLYDKLEKLRLPGIGQGTIRRTAEWFCSYNDDINLESDCFCLLSLKARKVLKRLNVTNTETLLEWIKMNHPFMSKQHKAKIISYINQNIGHLKTCQRRCSIRQIKESNNK